MQGILAPRLVAGRLDRFLAGHPDATTPFLVVDLDVVRRQYVSLTAALPGTEVFYAVKANPAPEVLSLLIELGSTSMWLAAGRSSCVLVWVLIRPGCPMAIRSRRS